MKKLKGIAASQGISHGKVFLFDNLNLSVPRYRIHKEDLHLEIERYESAINDTILDLKQIKDSGKFAVGGTERLIIDAHILMLDDPEIKRQVLENVSEKLINVEAVLFDVSEDMIELLNNSGDEYLKERALDVRDVCRRIVNKLKQVKDVTLSSLKEDVIVIAKNLLPSDTITMDKRRVRGFATDMGGKTSHTAILARSFEIPAVVGISGLSNIIENGDYLIIDGNKGVVIINPTQEVIEHYEEIHRKYLIKESQLLSLNDLEAETKDGKLIKLQGNIETPEEVDSVISHGASGIGLYRSEFLFMSDGFVMEEDYQYRAYKEVLEAMAGEVVTIRTLDVGGDKVVESLDDGAEDNPILGWRSIRFCLDKTEIFRIQLRALLRAGVGHNLRIMFPMISGASELDKVLEFVEEVKQELDAEKIDYNHDVPLGIMIEVPSAALTSDILAKKADFFSIGTNDLIQYTIAVDRGNEKIAYLYEAFHPGVLRLLKIIIDNAHKEGLSVSMCGEMAGDPYAAVVLLGLGLDVFSMSSVSIPEIKQIIRSVTVVEAEQLVGTILDMNSPEEINKHVKEWMNERFEISSNS